MNVNRTKIWDGAVLAGSARRRIDDSIVAQRNCAAKRSQAGSGSMQPAGMPEAARLSRRSHR